MERKVLAFFVFLALSGGVSAWRAESYGVAAARMCSEFNCECSEQVVVGVNEPDAAFRDTPAHHCYDTSTDYSSLAPGTWSRPTVNDCPALAKVTVWLGGSKEKTGCQRWHDFGVALHYFLDAKEFWNDVVAVNQSCRGEYEDGVNDYLQFGGRNWSTCSCGICVANDDFVDWLAEFRERIKPLVQAKHYGKPTVVAVSNSFDRDAIVKLGYYLRDRKVDMVNIAPQDLSKYKDSELILIAGGQNAPDTGPVVSTILTDEDKAAILKAVFTGSVIKKTNIWVSGQTVYFIAGYGINETADAVWNLGETLLGKALELSNKSEEETVECRANEDCGTAYHGPYICSSRMEASRVIYSPYCKNGVCMERASRPTSIRCGPEEVCVSFQGCVSDRTLAIYEGVHKPLFRTWLSRDMGTAIKGHSVVLSLYATSTSNDTMLCEYYGDGWEEAGSVDVNTTLEVMFNVSSSTVGKNVFTKRVRCGNETSEDEFSTIYYAEHNFTLMVIPPPIAFTFSLTPENITMADCFDRRNVTLRIENLCGHNITCNYTVGRAVKQVSIMHPGSTYNVTNYRFMWSTESVNYSYLSYYSGADFESASWNITDEDGNIITKNISQAVLDYYSRYPKNVTYTTVTTYWNATASYLWDYPFWSENVFTVDSDECLVRQIPVSVACTDEYGQHTTLKKAIYLNYTYT